MSHFSLQRTNSMKEKGDKNREKITNFEKRKRIVYLTTCLINNSFLNANQKYCFFFFINMHFQLTSQLFHTSQISVNKRKYLQNVN